MTYCYVRRYFVVYLFVFKIRPVDLKTSMNTDINKENIMKGPKLKVGDHVRISKCKNILAKGYVWNWHEEVFVIKNVKNTVTCTYLIGEKSWG